MNCGDKIKPPTFLNQLYVPLWCITNPQKRNTISPTRYSTYFILTVRPATLLYSSGEIHSVCLHNPQQNVYIRAGCRQKHTATAILYTCNEINSGRLYSIFPTASQLAACDGCRRWVDIPCAPRRPFRLSIDFICSRTKKAMPLFCRCFIFFIFLFALFFIEKPTNHSFDIQRGTQRDDGWDGNARDEATTKKMRKMQTRTSYSLC